MKVWVILESYTDYKGGNATSFGVFRSEQSAKAYLPTAIVERFGYGCIEEWEDAYGEKIENFMGLDGLSWKWDRGDDVIEFYIQCAELED